jgi:hypothetical protein
MDAGQDTIGISLTCLQCWRSAEDLRWTTIEQQNFKGLIMIYVVAWMQTLGELYPEYASEEHLAIHLTAGGVAGALASAVTTPLDVIKTRLQCQVLLFSQIHREEGLPSF